VAFNQVGQNAKRYKYLFFNLVEMRDSQQNRKRPVAVWSEKEIIEGQIADALVIVLRSKGCFWSRESGCLMCGYNNDCLSSVTFEDLVNQFELAMGQHAGQSYLKIYTSGSFFDPNEIEIETQERIMGLAGQKASQVLVESRPEFVTAENLQRATYLVKKLEVAVGLETANDDVRSRCINKGFQFSDYKRACGILQKNDASIRTYLLLKPPYISEGESINDVKRSIEKVSELSATISINPVNVQRGTVVESLWKRGHYRPPWLWSLIEVLKTPSNARLVSAPSGGGSKRGIHNCGKCDKSVLSSVRDFSLGGDAGIFEDLSCGCMEEWQDILDLEDFIGSTGNLPRIMKPQ
jgi:radical SAM enzyme (TIGR01210 family)